MRSPLLLSKNDNKYRMVNGGSKRRSSFRNNAFSLMLTCSSAARLLAAGEVDFPSFCSGETSHPFFSVISVMMLVSMAGSKKSSHTALSLRETEIRYPTMQEPKISDGSQISREKRKDRNILALTERMADSTPSRTPCTR